MDAAHTEIFKLAIGYTCTGAVCVTIACATLALIWPTIIPDEKIRKRLYSVVVLELAVAGVLLYGDVMKVDMDKVSKILIQLGVIEGKKVGLEEGKKVGVEEGRKLGLEEGRVAAQAEIEKLKQEVASAMKERDNSEAKILRLGDTIRLMNSELKIKQ